MRSLNDEQIIELYFESVERKIDSDFIELVLMELQRRGLGPHLPETKLQEVSYSV